MRWFERVACATLVVALTVPVSPATAATWDPVWQRSPGFSVRAVAADADGNVYVAGFARRGPVQYFGQALTTILVKYDPSGARVWDATWRPPGSSALPHAAALSVAVSPDGATVYVGGGVLGDSMEYGEPRVWAYSSEGTLRWVARRSDGAIATAVAARPAGIVAGGVGWVAAWGTDGSRGWTRVFLPATAGRLDVVRGLAIGSDGSIFVGGFVGVLRAGVTEISPLSLVEPGCCYTDTDLVLQRRTPTGAPRWSRLVADPDVRDHDAVLALERTGGSLLVAGQLGAGSGTDAWLSRLHADGTRVWARRWHAPEAISSARGVSPCGAAVCTIVERRASTGSATLLLRRLTFLGEPIETRTLVVRWSERPVGLTVAPPDGVVVAARVGQERGDVWKLPA